MEGIDISEIQTLNGEKLEDWTFAKSYTQYSTHGIHAYPARMIPQVALKLIRLYSSEGDWILDPFCGSGTTLVEAKLNGRNSVGNDINPLAVLISKVKTTCLDIQQLNIANDALLEKVREGITYYRSYLRQEPTRMQDIHHFDPKEKDKKDHWRRKLTINLEKPFIPNLKLWFKANIADELSVIKNEIDQLKLPQKYIDFYSACFSNTILQTCNADFANHQTHPVSFKGKELERHNPDVLRTYQGSINLSTKRLALFSEKCERWPYITSKIVSIDAKTLDINRIDHIPSEVDCIVTSPPYGEEHNTVAYIRWAKLALYWLGYTTQDLKKVSEKALGGSPKNSTEIPSKSARYIVDLVKKKSPQRAKETMCFFDDYYLTLQRMYESLKEGGFCCIVVGNRLIYGRRTPMDKVTSELGEYIGFVHVSTHYRDIPNKIMPYKIPEGKTMSKESIIILRKK